VAFTGTQKAAMLLTSLDADTASELLKGLSPDDVQEIAIELARIDASGRRNRDEEANIAREFYSSLQNEQGAGFSIKGFLNEMIVSILGKEKAEQVQSQIQNLTQRKDPFADIRVANTDELVLVLEGEHPQTIAVILSELAPRQSQEILALLSEETRINAVCKMTNLDMLRGGVKERIASMVSERLKSFKGETLLERPEQILRKLAIMLGGLQKDVRDRLLDEIRKNDEETANTVRRLMVTWDDIPSIADRSLQEGLRAAQPGKLAIALFEATPEIVKKIRSNISERLAATLDEEIALMQEPLVEEVLEAREEVVEPLRKASEEGTLRRAR
jgi:flagellar motor switch protein FliG